MSNVTADNLEEKMRADWKRKLKVPLGVSIAEEKGLANAVEKGNPAIIYAAWQYYINDEWMHNKGTPGIAQFLKHYNRYSVKVGRPMAEGDKPGGRTLYPLASYKCENGYNGCGANDLFHMGPRGTATPDVLEEPCYKCKGRMMREDLWFEAFVGGNLAIKALTPAPEPIASCEGLRGPTQDIVERAEVQGAGEDETEYEF